MLPVEPSNQGTRPRRAGPRGRRLEATGTRGVWQDNSPPQAVILPAARAPSPSRPEHSFHAAPEDRWSLRVELKELNKEEIAKLYSQGLTRGALVRRADMPEWRPLLTTPELSGVLHRTRLTLSSALAPPSSEQVTLPRASSLPAPLPPPPRLPSFAPAGAAAEAFEPEVQKPLTMAPTALDVAPASKPRRRGELLVVAAALGFVVAWFARGGHETQVREAAAPAARNGGVPTPMAVPLPAPAQQEPSSDIPRVKVADLPLLGASGRQLLAPSRARPARESSVRNSGTGAGPTRQELSTALANVANVASGCGERDGPVRVVISFANSGVARSIQVNGQGLAPGVRSCIIGAASRARVASFSGDPVTVSKSL